MQITIEIPDELAPQLAPADQDLARTALEVMAVEAYRAHRITGYQLRQLLGIPTRYEMDGLLKRHQVWLEYTMEGFEGERVISEQLRQADEKLEGKVNLSSSKDALTRTRGKYSFVQTSVDEFLRRKHEDVERDDSQCHQS